MIEFRWVALIALWTMLIGPVLDNSSGPVRQPDGRTHAAATKKR